MVVEGYWPLNAQAYSSPLWLSPSGPKHVVLNNGNCYFAATEATRKFQRKLMGVIQAEVYLDMGFAQTGFMKLMKTEGLQLRSGSAHELIGGTAFNLTVHAFRLSAFGSHLTGPDWKEKEKELRKGDCWFLSKDWRVRWEVSTSLDLFLARRPPGIT
jgi:hypothetical protein